MLTQTTLEAIGTEASQYANQVRAEVGTSTNAEVAGVAAFAAFKAAIGQDMDDNLEDQFIALAKLIA